jgi:hypothetical protein
MKQQVLDKEEPRNSLRTIDWQNGCRHPILEEELRDSGITILRNDT